MFLLPGAKVDKDIPQKDSHTGLCTLQYNTSVSTYVHIYAIRNESTHVHTYIHTNRKPPCYLFSIHCSEQQLHIIPHMYMVIRMNFKTVAMDNVYTELGKL